MSDKNCYFNGFDLLLLRNIFKLIEFEKYYVEDRS